MSDWPEHMKQREVVDKSQAIGEFVEEFLPSMGFTIATTNPENGRLVPATYSIRRLLAHFFDIDLDRLDDEKREMLAQLQEET